MYVMDFLKRMTRKANIPVLIYLVINVFIITGIALLLLGGSLPVWATILVAIVLYAISIVIALSPVGEWILRQQTGCKKITRQEELDFIEPIFYEVYDRAKQEDPSLPDDIELFISDDQVPNAFATGRKTVCITEGLLYDMPEDQIRATLGHEFGHLAHKDTDLILVVSVGNMIVTGFIIFLRWALKIGYFLAHIIAGVIGGEEGFLASGLIKLNQFLVNAVVVGLMWLWTKLGTVLVMKASRANEYEADEFSFNLGYGNELCELLEVIGDEKPKGLFANLAASHPAKEERISRLQALGATYRAPRIERRQY